MKAHQDFQEKVMTEAIPKESVKFTQEKRTKRNGSNMIIWTTYILWF